MIMFEYTIDKKKEITDRNGNTIVDFVTPLFNRNSTGVADYMIRRVGNHKFVMRPDLVSFAMYGTDDNTEYILKFSGISNPFTLSDEDILKIPNDQEVYGMMAINNDETPMDITKAREAQIRNNFKYYDPTMNKYNKDGKSYKDLHDRKMPSGIINKGKIQNSTGNIMVPYISEDGRTSITIRNGRVYFGTNSGIASADSGMIQKATNITSRIQQAIDKTATQLSDTNCMYNGTNLADFVRSNFNQ